MTKTIEAIRTLAMRCVTAAKARESIVTRCAELHAQGVKLGDARTCELSKAFLQVFHNEGLARGTASNYLAAVKRSVNDGAPFELNASRSKAQAKAKEAAEDSTEEAAEDSTEEKKDGAKRTPMPLAERLRRASNDENWPAFVALADQLAKTGASLATIVEQYIAAQTASK